MSKNFELLVRSQGHAEVLPPGRLSPEPPLERFSYDRLPLSHREPSDWERVSHILKKRWKPAMGFAMATFLAVAVATFMMKPVYEPTARVEIDPPGTEIFSMQSGGNGSGDSEYLQTEAQKMQSDELALEVIRALQLTGADVVHARFEQVVKDFSDGHQAHLVTVRAVRPDRHFIAGAATVLSQGGQLLLFGSEAGSLPPDSRFSLTQASLAGWPASRLVIARRL